MTDQTTEADRSGLGFKSGYGDKMHAIFQIVLQMSRVPSLKDLAFSAIPSRVPSLKQLARAAVAANRPPLPARTLARRQYDHKVDVVPRLIRRLWDAIFQAVARTTNYGNDVLTLLTPQLELWRRKGDWKIHDIPRPPPLRLRGNPGDSLVRPSEDQPRDQPDLGYVWNWNTPTINYERRFGDLMFFNRTRTRERWDSRHNIPLGFKGTQSWWNTVFPPVPMNQRRIHAEDFEVRHDAGHGEWPFGNRFVR